MSKQMYEGIAGIYDEFRPDYPRKLIEQFSDVCSLPEAGGLILDVGSGTGIAARRLRDVLPEPVGVIGIEPGDDMRRTAVSKSQNLPNLAFLNFPAENLPFANGTVNGVFVAQALHWFDRQKFYAEAARVLAIGGKLGIIQNNRNWQESAFLADYETILERFGDDYGRHYRDFNIEAELDMTAEMQFVKKAACSQTLKMPKEAFISWSFSSTKMQVCIRNVGEQKVRKLLLELIAHYFDDRDSVDILYQSELYLAQRGERKL